MVSSSPAIMRSSVDLPHPEGPTRTMNSPECTVRSTSRTAVVPSGYTLVTLVEDDRSHAHLMELRVSVSLTSDQESAASLRPVDQTSVKVIDRNNQKRA